MTRPAPGPVVDSAAAEVKVEDLDGGTHRLEALWAAQPVVLVFLRHFG